MRSHRLLSALGSLLLAVGCATLDVDTDYDPAVDFSALRTFDWFPGPDAPDETLTLTLKRLRSAVTSQLQAKGLSPASDRPDFLIRVTVSDRMSEAGDVGVGASVGLPIGGGLFSLGTGRSAPARKRESTVTLDFVAPNDSTPLWHGSATETVDTEALPPEQVERINRAVAKMLEHFPPRKQ
jgi:hypothetical protein